MTRDEMLAEAARITDEHGRRYAGKIPLNPTDSKPHDGGKSDYVEHAHLVSAPPEVDDLLNEQLVALLDRYRKSRTDLDAADRLERRYNFRDYWLHGEGAARWATWTELVDHLKKHVSAGAAKRIAAQWFHDRYGTWPGSDENRVAHGKPPRGDKVGPG